MAMYSDSTIFELIDLVYSAAADANRWPALLESLAELLNGNIATIHYQHLASMGSNIAINWNLEPTALEQYAEHYAPLNVWFTTRAELNTQGNVYTSEMLCPKELLIRTEFYNDWAEPFGMHQGAGVTVFKSSSISSNLSVFRLKNALPFCEEELRLLRALVPHLQRAFQLHNRIQELERKHDNACDALDQLRQGIVLLDAKGNVLLANRAANAIFASEKALRLTPRGLVAAIPSENSQLNALVQGAIHTGNGNSLHSGGAMMVSRDELRRPLQLLVTPLRTKTIRFGKDVPVVAIFISETDCKPISDSVIFTQLFGLTPAEARLASLLTDGEDLKDAAEQLGVAQSTARAHLKSIFSKTDTNRQSELVRILLASPNRAARE